MDLKELSLLVMGIFYIIAGLNHFIMPNFYLGIIPPALPRPKLINYGSGLAEIILGAALFIPEISHMAAWGIIVLLILVYPANIYQWMTLRQSGSKYLPLLWFRLPFQLVFILWAWWHTF